MATSGDVVRIAAMSDVHYNKTSHGKLHHIFAQVTEQSTLSETHYNYASFLASQGRHAEAREIAQHLLAKKATMPHFLKRRDRPWFRRAHALLKQLPQTR